MSQIKKLQVFINNILKRIIDEQGDRNKYLTVEAMKIWNKAFIHETVSYSNNYEDLEFLGDAVLKAVFPKYLMKRFPMLSKREYTELNIFYMSKMSQAKLGEELNLYSMAKVSDYGARVNIVADLFESFFGALDVVSDMITPGIGFANAYNMILNLFQDKTIDLEKSRGPDKTKLSQIFNRFSLGEPEIRFYKEDDNQNRAIINLTTQQIEFLKKHGINWKESRNVIADVTRNTKKNSEISAYEQAFTFLKEKYGINTIWAENLKKRLDWDRLDTNIKNKANRLLEKQGYKDPFFFTPGKTHTSTHFINMLVAVREDTGSKDTLISVTFPKTSTKFNYEEETVKKYIEENT